MTHTINYVWHHIIDSLICTWQIYYIIVSTLYKHGKLTIEKWRAQWQNKVEWCEEKSDHRKIELPKIQSIYFRR